MKFPLVCPICHAPLTERERSFYCPSRHCFDRARQGYIHLLPVQQKHSLAPGDAKEMLEARRRFLSSGYYRPLAEDVCRAVQQYSSTPSPVLLDCGCGEGYYTAILEQTCQGPCMGVDVSKEAARMACARSKTIEWLVATASSLPVADSSVDALTAIFSLFVNDEYARVLKEGGIVVEVTAGVDHLRELKELIYEEVFPQIKAPPPFGEAFREEALWERRFSFSLPPEPLRDLLQMTPHSRRMKREKMENVEQLDELTLTAHYYIRIIRKKRSESS